MAVSGAGYLPFSLLKIVVARRVPVLPGQSDAGDIA
jgi:hypothetical protein